ncbi:MAG: hypothetical protein GY821_11375 [Gammaproteobacteria bacterium]|nr:hypothetical protein [Gammaproteobacteria bacterium]
MMKKEDELKHFHEVMGALKSCQGLKEKRDKLLEYGFEWVDDGEDALEF